ncbi:Gfo/Idh/MocA family oxidoreductase [Serratia sp. D1N4]
MNILIIGLGYAGHRFLNSFRSLENRSNLQFAYVNRRQKTDNIAYYSDVKTALDSFKPKIVVVSVSDGEHANILEQLVGYDGFVICEKPLVNAADDLYLMSQALGNISGFCMDMVERYSAATDYLKNYVAEHQLRLIRAHFIWGKNRLKDHRTTCGAVSEIIHALDLIEWVANESLHLNLHSAIGSVSDFSISGDKVLDSVAIAATLGTSVVTGYSSFVNIVRQRTVDFTFASPDNKLIYAQITFDTPNWDIDHLKLWEQNRAGEHIIKQFTTIFPRNSPELATIQKLRRLVSEVLCFVENNIEPEHPFADLATSIRLQHLLNDIELKVQCVGPAKYELSDEREFFTEDGNLEKLG